MGQSQAHKTSTELSDFGLDVLTGLSSSPKYINSKYFYDEAGDKLFQQIMELDEYYLTRAEHEILNTHEEELADQFSHEQTGFQLVELGAGNGLKTKILLNQLAQNGVPFQYLPVDISQNALDGLMSDLEKTFPGLNCEEVCDDYFGALRKINESDLRKVVLFLGSNIGNFLPEVAVEFLSEMRTSMRPEDRVLIGIDLKKDPEIIRKAYDDSEGVTKAFNLNLLTRINRELGGNFVPDNFEHAPEYIKETGAARSFIRSKIGQDVTISKIGREFSFSEGERIYTEVSQKYSIEEIEDLAVRSGFELVGHYFDEKKYFVDTLWKPTD